MHLSLTLSIPNYKNHSLFFCCIERTTQYMEAMQYVINSSRIDMILGDFNINYLSEIHSQPLSLIELLNYTQIVTEPTFVSAGTLFDHVYVRLTSITILNNSVVSVFCGILSVMLTIFDVRFGNILFYLSYLYPGAGCSKPI